MSERNLEWAYKGFNLDPVMAHAYADQLERHITAVQEAGLKLGVPKHQLAGHDASKWEIAEFPHYCRYFFGGKQNPAQFEAAWLHHIHCNPHHWQYWIFPDRYQLHGGRASAAGAIPMPYHYVLEMVADWQGAGKVYSGEDDMTEWLSANLPRITLHPDTWVDLGRILVDLGYRDVLKKTGPVYIINL